ncbi:response regulator transcription factor [Nitriliruptor alkaliphilus]|uniref:response regulator transcription factor n=1 Tax=Nitriliruptor alkaliphilus TaxID=427918 RepID=UPI0006967BCE|nr:response regulator transcription factor [Nitriliruptor alkaliphilus]
MPTTAPRVLLVEDDEALRLATTSSLRDEGYEVRGEADGIYAREAASAFRPDVAVLDVRLPHGPSGLSVARVLREIDGQLPVIFLTAADSTEDRLAGFDAGADDYLVKPFAMAELIARVRALLRRSGRLTSDTWQVADIVVDEGRRRVHRGGAELDLTRTEFDLLVALGRNPDRVLSKTQLLASVWGFSDYDVNVVEVHVSALRRKLETHGPRVITTVRGAGYRLRPPT